MTQQDPNQQVTYFDNQTITIQKGEAIRVCSERDPNFELYSFRFLKLNSDPQIAEGINEVAERWRSREDAPGEYKVGMFWEYPFWGGLRYRVTGRGKVAFVIPFQKTFKAYEALGDAKWQKESWPFGDYIQYCRAFCDHPFFDEQGVYQVNTTWRSQSSQVNCPSSKEPKWNGGDDAKN